MSKNKEKTTETNYSSGRDIINPLLFGLIAVIVMAVISKIIGV